MATIRQAKVGERIKRELAELLQKEMRDPRLHLVTITGVDVARDFTVARVFISVLGSPEEKASALKALQGAAGFLRGHLGKALDMRTIPTLSFRYDTGIERGARMYELLREEQQALAQNQEAAAHLPEDDREGDLPYDREDDRTTEPEGSR
ncbi:MAG: 30S ribosome-binding factor RbfA [Capsulimonadales bacterium]|nr:30S ribosome-binding factor RbfA [Capsulimonadales bacterium]